MRNQRRWFGCVAAIGTMAAPWVMIASLAMHLSSAVSGHHGPAHHHVEDVDLALHGHHHPDRAPDHEHTIVLATTAPPRGKASILSGPVSPCRLAADDAPAVSDRFVPATGSVHGPPPSPRSLPVLRI